MNAPAQNLKAHVAHYSAMARQAHRPTLADMMNEGRRFPLSEEAAERMFTMLDRIDRATFRGPEIGPVWKLKGLERTFARMAASGQPFVVIKEGEGDE